MITYVNSVFVSNNTPTSLATKNAIEGTTPLAKGQFAIMNCDSDAAEDKLYLSTVSDLEGTNAIKIGMATGKMIKDHEGKAHNEIRWSNVIKKHDVKSFAVLSYDENKPSTEDKVSVDFTNIDSNILQNLAEGGKRVIIRLTFKDLPTRFRKWTESYEYVTKAGDDASAIASGIESLINKQWKRARVDAKAEGAVLSLTAMPYDDDDSVNTINWANKVRFNVNLYYTDPAAEGWESLNKHYLNGVTITKNPGYRYPAEAKLVRDRENQSFGYLGILNRGCCTWPIIQPTMNTNLDYNYSAVTLEFENMYRAADDIFRKTKQTVELYFGSENGIDANTLDVVKAIEAFATEAENIEKLVEYPAGVNTQQ